MLAALFSIGSSKSISDVLLGRWSGGTVFSTGTPQFQNLDFNLTYQSIKNYIITEYEGNPLYINLSFVDLSGNITYDEKIYDFNLTQTSPPLISSDIQVGDHKVHVSFCSHTVIKILILYPDGNSETVIIKKPKESIIFQSMWFIIMSVGGVIVYQLYSLFQYYMNRKRAQLAASVEEAKAKPKETNEKENEEEDYDEEEEEEETNEEKKEEENVADEKKDDDNVVKRSTKH
ncbi:hypothetical protein TVAG_402210 [Trichomonas vaginalis G3]|uniref:Uncharacterized protein n=1 Tax=Trichomonas vaginalis (strain ATCC PRA-98 / G3) TaxID=412133 RepID=A2DHX8_TRIV3|nr:hypothetical protein TVAGG3_0271750 [Trichomonas vaginalis G3]EAY19967.1 hypothetical protein TVAG_402210 [Trichomonas vaginalis G3]KAI5525917.1 hypothetical protein TVAGG3_0271750 [Trichomonas vaginalis G3]|eukprot:XP_001580953.1 hypothetical protein [Trichomonas vaginalis G3]